MREHFCIRLEGNGRENLGEPGQEHLLLSKTIDAKREQCKSHVISPPSLSNGRCSIPKAREKGISHLKPFRPTDSPPQIVAIGRNYLDHVKELNNAVPKEPFFFLKPTSSYLPCQTPGAKLKIPRGVLAHHEGSFPPSVLVSAHKHSPVELGLVIGAPGRDISQEDALNHVAGYSGSRTPPLNFSACPHVLQLLPSI